MKHKISITLILLAMFIITQAIGLFVINAYSPSEQTIINPATGESQTIILEKNLPFGLEPPENESNPGFLSIIFSFILAFAVIFTLMKYKWKMIIRLWFFLVVTIALAISLNAILSYTELIQASIISLTISIPLAFLKIFRTNILTHNLTELLIYPGIASVFVPMLTPLSVIALLIIISIYDMWAVWKSGIMQKMAKFQMEEVKIFGGFMIPSTSKKVRNEIKKIKTKFKNKKIPTKIKNKKFKVNLAILGGGDVIFPIIATGVFLRTFGLIPSLFVTFGALLGLSFLLSTTKKGKYYPAMPYISTGIFLGMVLAKLIIGF